MSAREGTTAARPSGWFWAKVVGAFLGLAIGVVLFVPFSSFEAYIPPGVEGCGSGWTNVMGMEFCDDFPPWLPIVAGLAGIAAGWGVAALMQRLGERRP